MQGSQLLTCIALFGPIGLRSVTRHPLVGQLPSPILLQRRSHFGHTDVTSVYKTTEQKVSMHVFGTC